MGFITDKDFFKLMNNSVYGKKIKKEIGPKKYAAYKNEFLRQKRRKKIISRISIL